MSTKDESRVTYGCQISKSSIYKVMRETGLTYEESYNLLEDNNGHVENTLIYIEKFMKNTSGAVLAKEIINNNAKNSTIYKDMAKNLSTYNTNRGGKNFKGFVFEDLHAANATVNGQVTEVIANNGIADFKIISESGKISYGQAKVNCRTSTIDWSLYKDQTIVIDKGNKVLIDRAKKAGCNVIESNISEKQAESLAKAMKLESKITGNTNSVIVPKIHSAGEIAKQSHSSGVSTAKNGALFGAGFSIGSNIVEVLDGEKELQDAAVDVVKDTAIAAGTSYAVGALTTAAASTSVGATVITGASAAASTAGAAIASTTAGATVIGATTAAATSAVATGAAVSGAIASTAAATSAAVASSAIGTAATAASAAVASSAVGAAATAAAATATAAVGAAAVAAAPVVLAGAAIGGAFTLGKKLFRK